MIDNFIEFLKSFQFSLFMLLQEQYIFIHEAILETILSGMNEVDSSKIYNEVEQLAKTKSSGMTGFQEKFKVCSHSVIFLTCCTSETAVKEGNIFLIVESGRDFTKTMSRGMYCCIT